MTAFARKEYLKINLTDDFVFKESICEYWTILYFYIQKKTEKTDIKIIKAMYKKKKSL